MTCEHHNFKLVLIAWEMTAILLFQSPFFFPLRGENDLSMPRREQHEEDFQSHAPPPFLTHLILIKSVGGDNGGRV